MARTICENCLSAIEPDGCDCGEYQPCRECQRLRAENERLKKRSIDLAFDLALARGGCDERDNTIADLRAENERLRTIIRDHGRCERGYDGAPCDCVVCQLQAKVDDLTANLQCLTDAAITVRNQMYCRLDYEYNPESLAPCYSCWLREICATLADLEGGTQ